jgi:hypothetical protein
VDFLLQLINFGFLLILDTIGDPEVDGKEIGGYVDPELGEAFVVVVFDGCKHENEHVA